MAREQPVVNDRITVVINHKQFNILYQGSIVNTATVISTFQVEYGSFLIRMMLNRSYCIHKAKNENQNCAARR